MCFPENSFGAVLYVVFCCGELSASRFDINIMTCQRAHAICLQSNDSIDQKICAQVVRNKYRQTEVIKIYVVATSNSYIVQRLTGAFQIS